MERLEKVVVKIGNEDDSSDLRVEPKVTFKLLRSWNLTTLSLGVFLARWQLTGEKKSMPVLTLMSFWLKKVTDF